MGLNFKKLNDNTSVTFDQYLSSKKHSVRAIVDVAGGVLVLKKTSRVKRGAPDPFELPGGEVEPHEFRVSQSNPHEALARTLRTGIERELPEETGLFPVLFEECIMWSSFQKRITNEVIMLSVIAIQAVPAPSEAPPNPIPLSGGTVTSVRRISTIPKLEDITLSAEHCGFCTVAPSASLPRFGLDNKPIDEKSKRAIAAHWSLAHQPISPISIYKAI